MAFTNPPPDITVPSGASLAAGTNTMYIGGPSLPSELTAAGFRNAIVFYSGAAGAAAGIEYWFIAHESVVAGVSYDGMVQGFKKIGDPTIHYMHEEY
jgi:hypothetical protein